MTTPDTLSVLRARAAELDRHLSHCRAELAGFIQLIDATDDPARDTPPTVGHGTYRGSRVDYTSDRRDNE